MQETDLHYPPETCPFCNIAAAFPFPAPSSSNSPTLWTSRSKSHESYLDCVPKDGESDPEKTNPSSFVVLRSKDVVAFLDILPMTGGKFHVHVVTLFAWELYVMETRIFEDFMSWRTIADIYQDIY